MKVALLALSPREHGGQFQYTVTLIEALGELAQRGCLDLSVVHRTDYDDLLAGQPVDSVSLRGWRARLETQLAMYLGTGLRACATGDFDVAVSPKACLAARKSARRSVVVIHDLQHRRLPHLFSPWRRVLRDWLYRRTATSADRIVCETEYVKRDVSECYGIAPDRIDVVPCPPPSYVVRASIDADRMTAVKQEYRLPGDYLFYPAQFWAHKNHIVLLESLKVLKSVRGVAVPLVLAGSPKRRFAATMSRVRELGLESQVHYLGYVPDADMPYVFKAAAALVMPSLFESLSLPVWEAFHLGVPVVCANTSTFPEQVGSAALMFDPYSPDDCAAKIYECLTHPALAAALVVAGRERVRGLTPQRHAAQWQEVLARATAM